jgi:hypothetical protein
MEDEGTTLCPTRASMRESNLKSVHALIKGKISKRMLETVEARQGHAAANQARDPVGLLKFIKGAMFDHNSKKHRATSLIANIKPDLCPRHGA